MKSRIRTGGSSSNAPPGTPRRSPSPRCRLRLSEDLRHISRRGLRDGDPETIRKEKLWLLMLLAHEAGGDFNIPGSASWTRRTTD